MGATPFWLAYPCHNIWGLTEICHLHACPVARHAFHNLLDHNSYPQMPPSMYPLHKAVRLRLAPLHHERQEQFCALCVALVLHPKLAQQHLCLQPAALTAHAAGNAALSR